MQDIIDDDSEPEEPIESGPITVTTPTGETVTLLNIVEKDYYEGLTKRYQDSLAFQNPADLESLKLIVALETMLFRWQSQLLSGKGYDGKPILPEQAKKSIKEVSTEVRQLKAALGIDRATRERDGGDNFSDRWQNVLIRAKRFNYMRNQQSLKARALWFELVSLLTFYQNSNDEERTEFHMHAEDVINWAIGKIPEFEEIDAAFRQEQAMWIRNPLTTPRLPQEDFNDEEVGETDES